MSCLPNNFRYSEADVETSARKATLKFSLRILGDGSNCLVVVLNYLRRRSLNRKQNRIEDFKNNFTAGRCIPSRLKRYLQVRLE